MSIFVLLLNLINFNIAQENILLAKPDATDEEIWEALTEANAADFIRKLPKQLSTDVGEAGTQLSGDHSRTTIYHLAS